MPGRAEDASSVDLSIIIPVWNERRKIGGDLRAAAAFCLRHGYRCEILVADDGSSDGTAAAAAACAPLTGCALRVLPLSPHRGKGYAVRQGMAASQGHIVLFMDSGGCMPWEEIRRGLQLIESGACRIAHASRRLPGSRILRPQSLPRRFTAFLFRHFMTRLLGLPRDLTDTQAGLKVYAGETARMLYGACHSQGFLFDAEVILRAVHAGLVIREFPVTWSADRDSRLRLQRLPFSLLREALHLKRALRREFTA
ncbi:MAG TPA: glycosyltransferase [bacterium]|nr:glycosyltransferase [bacterium]HPR88847.1 glycosyltransferase [bacterium]